MSNEGGSQADRDLLARLNALKKTHIDLDDKKYQIPVTAHIPLPADPSPAKALHGDLVSRFNFLNGNKSDNRGGDGADKSDADQQLAVEDSKTIEELLSELGGEGAWNIDKDEATQIDDLLHSANATLKDISPNETANDGRKLGNDTTHDLPSLDVEISKPDGEPEDVDEEENPPKSKQELEAEVDREADDIVARLKHELKNAPPEPESDEDDEVKDTKDLPTAPMFDLPTTPSTLPEPASDTTAADNDLASRFASLSLPSTPSNTLPSAPSTKPGKPATKFGSSAKYAGHTDEDIDSWCTICCEDATLRCLGCDGDLYCAKCWVEGHRGPDAGYDERTHRAVEYNRKSKKEPRRRVAA